jgi:hypothetical protein
MSGGGNIDILSASERRASNANAAIAAGAESARKARVDEAKNLIDAFKARASVAKDDAEGNKLRAAVTLADRYLATNKGDYAGAAGVLGLHPVASKTSIIPGFTPDDPVIFAKEGRGAPSAIKVIPRVQITEANITAELAGSMKGKSRAQAIQAHKDRGDDVSGIR